MISELVISGTARQTPSATAVTHSGVLDEIALPRVRRWVCPPPIMAMASVQSTARLLKKHRISIFTSFLTYGAFAASPLDIHFGSGLYTAPITGIAGRGTQSLDLG